VNFKFYYIILLTVITFIFCSYTLLEKKSYLDSLKKKLEKSTSSNLNDFQGKVFSVENPGKVGAIFLIGDIDYIVAMKTIEYLKSMAKNHQEIDLYLYTKGGGLTVSLAIADTIKQIKIKVNTYAIGFCFSGGTYILAAGTGIRYASKYAFISLHFISKDADAHKGSFSYVMNQNVAKFWKTESKLPVNINTSIPRTYDLSPDKAREWGIVDVVY
jgi:ATP-dependent protease ClpP protease subunit